MKTATPEQKEAAEARRLKFRSLAKQLSALPAADRAALAARLPGISTIEGRSLSTFNMCLIAAQCPSATVVGGFKQWRKAGRSVRKGEHGLSLWVPCGTVKRDDGSDRVQFISGVVFDVAQTEELPAKDAAPEVTASSSAEVAAFIDPDASLQRAGLLRVAA